jgi:hypothetical protein
VASDSTCWRLLDRIDDAALAGIARARAAAREVAWAQHAETHGQGFPAARAAGRDLPGLVVDLDASIVIAHSEKEQAAPTFKGTRSAITPSWPRAARARTETVWALVQEELATAESWIMGRRSRRAPGALAKSTRPRIRVCG